MYNQGEFITLRPLDFRFLWIRLSTHALTLTSPVASPFCLLDRFKSDFVGKIPERESRRTGSTSFVEGRQHGHLEEDGTKTLGIFKTGFLHRNLKKLYV
jgi:hypothetical protein